MFPHDAQVTQQALKPHTETDQTHLWSITGWGGSNKIADNNNTNINNRSNHDMILWDILH